MCAGCPANVAVVLLLLLLLPASLCTFLVSGCAAAPPQRWPRQAPSVLGRSSGAYGRFSRIPYCWSSMRGSRLPVFPYVRGSRPLSKVQSTRVSAKISALNSRKPPALVRRVTLPFLRESVDVSNLLRVSSLIFMRIKISSLICMRIKILLRVSSLICMRIKIRELTLSKLFVLLAFG